MSDDARDPGGVASPCVRNCCLDDRDVCLGCHRTLAQILRFSRQSVIYGQWPDPVGVAKTTAVAVVVMVVGWLSFRRLQLRLAEHF